ncbi:MAG: DTW domain-containing protein [Treponema sp.]|nr:DTW domain-containing protein [Treponema sp.]
MATRCYRCFRPVDYCLCRYVDDIDAHIRFVFLMHPKEAKRNRTGTGRIAHSSLRDSELFVGLTFSGNERLLAVLTDERYFPVLLYPGDGALTVRSPLIAASSTHKQLLVIVIDATWFCARKIIEHNPFLLTLPRLSFAGTYTSIFTFKREPRPEYLSTIESCYYLITEARDSALIPQTVDAEPLMRVFKQLITAQLQAENDRIAGKRPDTHAYNWKYTRLRTIPRFDR